jgi:hypothetical protein
MREGPSCTRKLLSVETDVNSGTIELRELVLTESLFGALVWQTGTNWSSDAKSDPRSVCCPLAFGSIKPSETASRVKDKPITLVLIGKCS